MSFVQFFKDWVANNGEKKKFKESWMEQYGNEMGSSNSCRPYHEMVAYEIFKLTQRVEQLENQLK